MKDIAAAKEALELGAEIYDGDTTFG